MGTFYPEVEAEDDRPASARAEALHKEAVAEEGAVEWGTGAKTVEETIACGFHLRVEAQGFTEVGGGGLMVTALEGGPTGIGMGEGILGIASEHPGEVGGVFGEFVLEAEGLGQLIGRDGVVGLESESESGGDFGGRPVLHLEMSLGLGSESAGALGIKGERRIGTDEPFLRTT